jgi:hypothetical protein
MIHEFEKVVLTVDLPSIDLLCGDIGTVVMIHDNGAGYEVEFMTLNGETVAVETLFANQVRAIRKKEIASVRELKQAA